MQVGKGYYMKIKCGSWMRKLWSKLTNCRYCKNKKTNRKLEFIQKYFKDYEASKASPNLQNLDPKFGNPSDECYDRSVIYKCR